MGRVDVYTKVEIADLMAKLAEIKDGDSVVDMSVGSGNLLLGVTHASKNPKTLKLFGFDIDKTAIIKSSLILKDFNYISKLQDSLDLLKDKTNLYDISILNPPWNLPIGKYSKILKVKGKVLYQDWIWMFVSVNIAKRKSVVIESQSVLSRIKGEFQLRKKISDMNIIESVVLLPNNSFESAKLDSAIIVFNKLKKDDKVLFVDGTEISKGEIADIVLNKTEIRGVSIIVGNGEISKNNYNLNPIIYLHNFDGTNAIKIKDVFRILTNGIKPETFNAPDKNRIPWITINDVKKYDGDIIKKSSLFIYEDDIIKKKVRGVPKNSLILTGRASIGKIAIIDNFSSFDRGCIALVPKENNLDLKKYIEPIRRSVLLLKATMPGTTYKSLAKRYIENLPIYL